MTDPQHPSSDSSPPDVMNDSDIEAALDEAASLVTEIVSDAGEIASDELTRKPPVPTASAEDHATEASVSFTADLMSDLTDHVAEQIDGSEAESHVSSAPESHEVPDDNRTSTDATEDREKPVDPAKQPAASAAPFVSPLTDADLMADPNEEAAPEPPPASTPTTAFESAAADEQDDDLDDQVEVPAVPSAAFRLASRLVGVLELVDKPLAGVGTGTRQLLGWIGLATLTTCLLALLVLG